MSPPRPRQACSCQPLEDGSWLLDAVRLTECSGRWIRARRLCNIYKQYHPLIIAEFADADDYKADGQFKKETDTGYHSDHAKTWA